MIYFICAGKGSRMSSEIPKALHEVQGVPNVLRNSRIVQNLGQEFRVVLNKDDRETFLKFFSEEHIISINSGFGSGHAVMLLDLEDDDLIIWGDAIINNPSAITEMLEYESDAPLSLGLKKVTDPYVQFGITSCGSLSEVRFKKYCETSNSGYQDSCVFKVKKDLTKHLKSIHNIIWKNRYITESGEFEFLYIIHYLYNIGDSADFYISSYPEGVLSYNTKEELKEINKFLGS